MVAAFREAWRAENQAKSSLLAAALALEVAAGFLGGASQGNALELMIVELASLPLLFLALYMLLAREGPKGAILPLILLAAVVAVPFLQLVPLPFSVWSRLPGRETQLAVLQDLGLGAGEAPLSLAPEQTWRDALALCPPAAMFMGALLLGDLQRRAMAWVWLAIGMTSIAVGGLQLAGGPDSPFYFYSITNAGSAVGLFANRNHQASFLAALISLAAVFAGELRGLREDRRGAPPLLATAFVFVAVVGVAITHSRAGLALLAPAMIGAAAIVFLAGKGAPRAGAAAGFGLASLAAILAVALFGLGPILDRFAPVADMRFTGWPIVSRAASDHLPMGSGLGSFQLVYLALEPLGFVSPIYFNHAHNDYLELWLEAGLVAAVLLGLFLLWFAWRSARAWFGLARDRRRALGAAATIVIGLLLAHSAVDYPLRTETSAVLFAFACGAIA